MSGLTLNKIEGYDELRRASLRWVVRQGRDPEQAIKSLCAELADIRTLPMFLARLSEERVIEDEAELQKILRLISNKNLRALSYLLRAHLLIHHTFYSALRDDIRKQAKELSKQRKDPEEIERAVYEDKDVSDRIKIITTYLYGTLPSNELPEELRKRIKRWIEETLKEDKKE